MRRPSILVGKDSEREFRYGSRNWLLHARYVRGEHAKCLELADELQKKADNTHRYAHYIKGLVYANAGRHQEALERFHSCIRLQPQDPEPLKQVARSLYCQGRYQLSLEAYLEADKLTKHPDSDIYCALAECCSQLGQAARGAEWARAGVRAGGGERAGALLARLLLAAGDAVGAAQAYDQAIATHACGADTLAAAGALRLRAGAPREAFQLLGAALAQQPTQHAAQLALAAMMLQHRDLDASLARLKAALSAHPTCVAAHSNLGLALLAKKKYVAALTCLQRAVWSAPLSARASHNLGLALLLCRRPASAFCRLATAAALQPHQPYTARLVSNADTVALASEGACLVQLSQLIPRTLALGYELKLQTVPTHDCVLLIAIALERLGDARADAAYARAAALAADDALVRLNRAARLARAGLAAPAAAEARAAAELLRGEDKADAQLSSSLATLLALLREAGVQLADLPDGLPRSDTPDVTEDMTADEV